MNAKKILLIAAGFTALGLGLVGIALPVLPTTPFILLSAICFSASNSRFSRLLQKNKYFSSYIDNYKNKTGIPGSVKIGSIIFLWTSLLVSMILLKKDYLYILLPVVGVCVTIHIALIKTQKK